MQRAPSLPVLNPHEAVFPHGTGPSSVRRSRARLGVLVLFGLASVLPGRAWAQDDDRPVLPTPDQLNVYVIPGGETIEVDGILDELRRPHDVPSRVAYGAALPVPWLVWLSRAAIAR